MSASLEMKIYGAPAANTAEASSKAYIPKEYKEVARAMEQQFIEYMVKQMNKTFGDSDNSMANDYYKSLLDTERSKLLSEHNGGLGLQDMILDQIYPKKFRNKDAYAHYQKQQNIGRK